MSKKPCSEETKLKLSLAMKKAIAEGRHTSFKKGDIVSEETKMKRNLTRKGFKFSEESKLKISLALKGKKKSAEHCRNIGLSGLGRKRTEEDKKGISDKLKGIVRNSETRLKMSLSAKKRGISDELQKKMIANHRGCHYSEEIKARMRDGRRKGENSPSWQGGISLNTKKYRDKRKELTKDLYPETIQLVYEDNIKKYGTLTCYLCLKPIDFGKDCLEHKTPVARGGSNLYENLGIAHRRCNGIKHAKTEQEYKEYMFKKTGELLPEVKSAFGSFS